MRVYDSQGLQKQNQVTATTADGFNRIAAGTVTAAMTQTVFFADSNGVSFGLNTGANSTVVTASHNAITSQSNQTLGLYASSNTTGQSSSSTFNATSVHFVGAGVASVGYSAGSVIVSVPAGGGAADGFNRIAAGTVTAATLQTVVFSDSNGISFGLGTGANSTVLTASHNALTSQSNQAISGSNGSFTFQTVTFGNLNGLSFYSSNGSMVGSYTVPTQSVQTLGIYHTGNTTGESSSSTYDARSLTVRGDGIVSVGWSNSSLRVSAVQTTQPAIGSISVLGNTAGNTSAGSGSLILAGGTNITLSGATAAGAMTLSVVGGAGAGGVAISAGANSQNTGTVIFSNSNGITFGLSNDGMMTASYTVPTQTNQTLGIYATGNTTGESSSSTYDARSITVRGDGIVSIGWSNSSLRISASQSVQTQNMVSVQGSTGAISFGNANGITFGFNASTITASHNGITSQTNQTGGIYFVGNTTGQSSSSTYDARTLSIDGAGMVSVGWSNSTVRISATQSNQTLGLYFTSNTTQSSSGTQDARSLTFHGAGIASVGYSNGSVVVSVPAGGGAGDGVNIIAAGTQTANTTGTVVFSNSNGVSFGMSNSSVVTAEISQATLSNSNNVSFGIAAGVITATATLAGNIYAVSNTTLSSSMTVDLRTVSFAGAGAVSVGASNGTVVVSAPAPLTVSMWPDFPQPLASSSMYTGSTTTTAGGSRSAISIYLAPIIVNNLVTFNRVEMLVSQANTVAGTGSHTNCYMAALYTLNAGTALSLVSSFHWAAQMSQNSVTAQTIRWYYDTNSNANSTAVNGNNTLTAVTGIKNILLSRGTMSLAAGEYVLAVAHSRSTAGVAMFQNDSLYFVSASQTTGWGSPFGSNTFQGPYGILGGIVSTTVSSNAAHVNIMPSSIHTSAVTNTGGSASWRIPTMRLVSFP